MLRAAQLAVGVGARRADAGGQQAERFRPLQQRDVADVVVQRRDARPLCASTRYCTANSTSIMPPGPCLTSNTLVAGDRVRGAHLARASPTTSAFSAATSRGAAITARRTASKRGASEASPAHKRARVMAWCSQVQAVLLPRPAW